MTEDDIIAPGSEPDKDQPSQNSDIAHDHALFKLVNQAQTVVDAVGHRSQFLEQAVAKFEELTGEANRQGSNLALVSYDIAEKWRNDKDDESLSEDLQFLIKQAPTRYRHPLEYEGLDMSEHDLQWRRSLDGVGEKVRLDSDQRVSGIDQNASIALFGDDELTISKAIVRGEEVSDGFGGSRTAAILEYEFEGHEGRHNANQFMEAEGREHAYGVLMVEDGRAWLTPIDITDFDNPKVLGEAREIFGYAGKIHTDHHPDGIDGVISEISSEGPISGEHYFRPRDGYGSSGPIALYSSPWQAPASEQEIGIGEKAIKAALSSQPPERIHSKGLQEHPVAMPDRGIER